MTDLNLLENFRDLGGYPAQGNLQVKKARLYRSGHLGELNDSHILQEHGIGTIIDFRTQMEQAALPDQVDQNLIQLISIPIMQDRTDLIQEIYNLVSNGIATRAGMRRIFIEIYSQAPYDYADQYRSFFKLLLQTDRRKAVLFHCTGGKDRTGIASVFLLHALGVNSDIIRDDFLLTNQAVEAERRASEAAERINAELGTSMNPQAVLPALGVRPYYIDTLYESIRRKSGSLDRYLESTLGLSQADLEQLQAKYLE